LHWGRRRADDAYSALDYLIEKMLAKPDEVYIMGHSNGGTATLVSMTKKEADHKHQFTGAFVVASSCFSDTVRDGRSGRRSHVDKSTDRAQGRQQGQAATLSEAAAQRRFLQGGAGPVMPTLYPPLELVPRCGSPGWPPS
jgi:dienelactone hydrolase